MFTLSFIRALVPLTSSLPTTAPWQLLLPFYRWRCRLTCPRPLSMSLLKFIPGSQPPDARYSAHSSRTVSGQSLPSEIRWQSQMCAYSYSPHVYAPVHTGVHTQTHPHTPRWVSLRSPKNQAVWGSPHLPSDSVICLPDSLRRGYLKRNQKGINRDPINAH